MSQSSFDDLLNFPHLFIFRIVAENGSDVLERCVEALEQSFGRKVTSTESLPSKTGRFLRLHIAMITLNGAEIYAGYDALRKVEGIRMAL